MASNFLLRLALLPLATALVAASAGAGSGTRVTLDLGAYRGPWSLIDSQGRVMAQDSCLNRVPACRETMSPLPDGTYELVFSPEPQSKTIRVKLANRSLSVLRGQDVVSANLATLRLNELRRVTFDLQGYKGAWWLDRWATGKERTVFKSDGSSQAFDLVPETTYALAVGTRVTERFQVSFDGRILLLDDRGAVRAWPPGTSRLEFQTLDAVVYPMPDADRARWTLDGLPSPGADGGFVGPQLVRLAQGTAFRIVELPATATDTRLVAEEPVETQRSCNMVPATRQLGSRTYYVIPIQQSCQR